MSVKQVPAARFTKTLVDIAPVKSGVYVFWKVTAIGTFHAIYVGMSKSSIRSRLQGHYAGSHNDGLRMVISGYRADILCCWRIVESSKVKAIESRLIRRLNPLENISERK